ncbi:GTPase/DUF3482 domain-containing protein [Neisseria animalis]|uniref:DUF3482 domain-containing protein n=1 Tax=Neisseria animalis TaxID=492 RepID=A0A5P3MP99_NEIAN|nr:GTPase/DUF3482 domain-containing protein [Neisseria animalis]QEY23318.1 DUF3482 domain-containing protein [Neisseria animalis]ROW33167.1 DUF3482 domain-containing protein [Neisseria animalis]VEE08670.1 integral membrane protein [Neisseria animalis]
MNTAKPLSLAVVGHTNTGKTSLLRTLLRDGAFGEVKNAPATTRHVEEAAVSDGGETLVRLYDTPGLEDAGGVLDWLETNTSAREDGIERLHRFLDSEEAASDFNQEAKVLRQLMQSDMALYVVDAREPVLAKYKDELTVLSWCAKPVMPVFNFTGGQDLGAWAEMLARRTLHVYSSFDTVAFDFEGEIRLWDNLATMLPSRMPLDRLIDMRRREWQMLDKEARYEIADFLLDIAAYRQEIDADDSPEPVLQTMQTEVRQLERQLQRKLLQLYRFYHSEIGSNDWVLQPFEQDPFDSDLLLQYGIRTGKGATAGALIGMGLDIVTLGGSLGLGTAIGGLLGGVLPNMQDISDKISGRQTLHIGAETLTLLAARALELLSVLQTRGHAAQARMDIGSGKAPWKADKLPSEINKARNREQWSSLNTQSPESSRKARNEAADSLAVRISNNI